MGNSAAQIDPRHRYGHNLHFYYDIWFKSESNQPFFYWWAWNAYMLLLGDYCLLLIELSVLTSFAFFLLLILKAGCWWWKGNKSWQVPKKQTSKPVHRIPRTCMHHLQLILLLKLLYAMHEFTMMTNNNKCSVCRKRGKHMKSSWRMEGLSTNKVKCLWPPPKVPSGYLFSAHQECYTWVR